MSTFSEEEIIEQATENRRKFRVDHFDIVISEYIRRHSDGKVILDPPYQRTFRWDIQTQSELIESIIVGIPMPPIFAFTNSDYRWEIIDGVQRTNTLINFFNGNLTLEGCSILKKINNLNIDTLPEQIVSIVENARLRIELIEENADSYGQYLLFSRLNSNGEDLSSQELRNFLIYKLNPSFYIELNNIRNHESFKNLINLNPRRIAKQEDVEYILRFLILRNSQKGDQVDQSKVYNKIDELISQEIQLYLTNTSQEEINLDCQLFKETYDYLDSIENLTFKATSAVNTSVIVPTLSFYLSSLRRQEDNSVLELIQNFYDSEQYKRITAQ